MMNTVISDKHLHILQHSLGLDQYGQGKMYRNRFVTGRGDGSDWQLCVDLERFGLMRRQQTPSFCDDNGYVLFMVTDPGIDYVRTYSPKAPKLTRSQKRYRRYLANADCFQSFREFLKYEHEERKL